MNKLLAVGGPNHGDELADDGSQQKTVMAMVNHPNDPLAPPVALPTRYIKRGAEGVVDNKHYRRFIWVHESIRSPEEMAQFLANHLLGKWIEEGGEIVEGQLVDSEAPEVVPSGDGGGASAVGPQPPRTASGLYLS